MDFDYQPEGERRGGVAVLGRVIASPAIVAITLKNPPARGNYWQLILMNEVWGDSMRVGQHIPVDQPIILESLPSGWSFPLYMDIMIYELNVSPYNVIYKAQSAYGSDWPDYNPGLVIPDLGNFFFDVATGNFEEEEPPPPPKYDGVIVLRKLWSGGQLVDFPTSMPLGVSVQVIVAGRNDNPTTERMRIEWIVKDPTGWVEQEYGDSGSASPGHTWGIAGAPLFNLDKPGDWTIEIYMGFRAPDGTAVLVDSYSGTLCSVLVEEEFKGSLLPIRLGADEKEYVTPIDVEAGAALRVIAHGRNNMSTTQVMGVNWIVKDPGGRHIQDFSLVPAEWINVLPGEYLKVSWANILFEATGDWTIEVELLMNPGNPFAVDRYSGVLCTVIPTGEAEIEYEVIMDQLYEPEASTYKGKAEVATIYFDGLPEQIPGIDFITAKITEAVATNIIAQDGKMLRLRIFRGAGEWYNSKWKVEATIHASPFAWAVVVPLIVVLLIVVGLAFISYQVKEIDWEEIPLAISWWPLAIVGVLGVLGVGAAVALGARPR